MVKVTFLGTADSIPSSTRNHTSILLSYKGENILVDCGEGTQRQFRIAKLNPLKVTRILITHWHGDHVLGLPGLLSTLSLSGYSRDLYIYGPVGIKKKVDDMLKASSFRMNYKIIARDVSSGRFFEDDDFYLEAAEMQHGIPCIAYSFVEKARARIDKGKLERSHLSEGRHLKDLLEGRDIVVGNIKYLAKNFVYTEEGKKVSIVMDTKNHEGIVKFVRNADLFICEAAYDSSLKREAGRKKHMAIDQVAKAAKRANVKKLILTHVSSRYLKNMRGFLNEAKEIFSESYLVRDFDVVEV